MEEESMETKAVGTLEVDPEKDVSYINMTLLDASKTIETTVKEKLRERVTSIKYPMVKKILSKESVQDKIASKASQKVKPSMVAKGLAEQMPKLLMYTMYQKIGMTMAAKTVFCEDAYIVIEFQVKKVDTQKFLQKIQEGIPDDMDDEDLEVPPEVLAAWLKDMESSISEESAPIEGPQLEKVWTWSGWIASQSEYVVTKLLPKDYKESLEDQTLPPFVQTKITEEMGAMMAKKMQKKQLEAEIAVLPSTSQARYFYSNLEAVRERQNK